jgi:DNA-binding MarR family transcriptional regulator
MPSYFIGELSETRLFDLIKPLLDGKKSGMISIKGREYGEIHIEGGRIIHAWTNHNTGEEAILAIMEWRVGRVSFDWEVTTGDRTVSAPTEQLLLSWANREEELKKIREIVPSPGVMFRIAMQGGTEDMSIHGDQWKVLALCNGSNRVSEIADSLNWDIFKTSKTIFQMVQGGLLERAGELLEEQKPVQRRSVNGSFFPLVENELKKLMGPIAPIIIDDIIAEIGESKESFPQEMVDKLLESIVAEIPDMAKRAEFNKVIHNALVNENKAKL